MNAQPPSVLLRHALEYAEHGWPVFPCDPKTKAPLIAGGFHRASRDLDVVRRWWSSHPHAMIGVPTGPASGFSILDVDVDEASGVDGPTCLAQLEAKHSKLPETVSTRTPRGGLHLLFRWSPQHPLRNSAGKLDPGLDVRGDGGYAIVPPSVRPDGVAYRFENPTGLFDIAEAPDWLLQLACNRPSTVIASAHQPQLRPTCATDARSEAYLAAALESELDLVRTAAEGTRNDQLNRSAFNLGQFVSAGLLDGVFAESGLLDAALACGLVKDDREHSVRNTIASGLKAGAAHPRKIPSDAPGRARERARSTATRDETVSEALDLDDGVITQDGVARVFANRYAGKLRFCHHTVAWFEWTGAHWKQDDTELAFQFARSLGREASAGAGPKDLKEVRKVAFASGVERFARGDRAVAVTSVDWDQHAFLLGTPEGTVDLATGRLRPADPAEGITKVTRVAPAAAPSCPLWLRFLDETFDSDRELIRFVQQWCGYTLTGDVREHALVFGSGPGGNGKSVLVNTVSGILGDYAATAAMDTFTASRTERHTTELAMLRGARMVTASETEEGRPWAESRIKQLTGGDWVTARFMREDNFTYRPTFKLTIIGNHQPELRNVDEAMRRRVNIIPGRLARRLGVVGPGLEQLGAAGELRAVRRLDVTRLLEPLAEEILLREIVRSGVRDCAWAHEPVAKRPPGTRAFSASSSPTCVISTSTSG
jgi:putative DNA primase/helicase